jgi:hypothetical protein
MLLNLRPAIKWWQTTIKHRINSVFDALIENGFDAVENVKNN